jgi:hypothetical protein
MLPTAEIKIIGILVLVAALWIAVTLLLKSEREQGAAACQAQYAAAAASASEAARAEETRRQVAQKGITDEATKQIALASSARAGAIAAARSLRQRTADLASRCSPGDTAASIPGAAASSPGDLLTDMQQRLDDAAGQFAAYADSARIAGAACVSAYNSLTLK